MSDPIRFNCSCGKSLKADPRLVGKKAKCPRCGLVTRVPSPAHESAAVVLPALDNDILDDDIPVGVPLPPSAVSYPARPASRPQSVPQQKPISIWDDDDGPELDLASDTTGCPECHASMPQHAVVCLGCGYNKQTGKRSKRVLRERAAEAKENSASKSNIKGPLLLSMIAFAVLLCLSSFFSIGIALITGLVGVALLLLGLSIPIINGLSNMSQTEGVGELLFKNVLLNLLFLPFGWVVFHHSVTIRRGGPTRARRSTKVGWSLAGIGTLMIAVAVLSAVKYEADRKAQNQRMQNNLQEWPQRRPLAR